MSDVATLLPPNATSGERALEQATARIEQVPLRARQMWNADTIPAHLLPWLAWAFSVDDWDVNWSDTQKRAAIKAAYEVQRRKGTIGAVRRALAALGVNITIVEWFEEVPAGEPYTFRLIVNAADGGAPELAMKRIMDVVNSSKNLRSHLASIDTQLELIATQFLACVTLTGHEINVMPFSPIEGGWMITEDGAGVTTERGQAIILEL